MRRVQRQVAAALVEIGAEDDVVVLRLPSLSPSRRTALENSKPSMSSRRMKLTAPAIASEPYTAEAPPVIISTRFTSAAGDGREVDVAGAVGRNEAPAVDERQRARGAESSQVRGEHAGGATGIHARVDAGRELRELVDRALHGGIARELQHVLADDRGRARRTQIAARQARAGDGDPGSSSSSAGAGLLSRGGGSQQGGDRRGDGYGCRAGGCLRRR